MWSCVKQTKDYSSSGNCLLIAEKKVLKFHYKIIYLDMWVLLAIILSNLFPVINQVPRDSSL